MYWSIDLNATHGGLRKQLKLEINWGRTVIYNQNETQYLLSNVYEQFMEMSITPVRC